MKYTLNKSRNDSPTVSLELTKRELELLIALCGNSTPLELNRLINGNTVSCQSGTASLLEIVSLFGNRTYSELMQAYDDMTPDILKVVEFVYDKQAGEPAKWRTLHVTDENSRYIEGLENGDTFKRFLKSKITGGRIITIG